MLGSLEILMRMTWIDKKVSTTILHNYSFQEKWMQPKKKKKWSGSAAECNEKILVIFFYCLFILQKHGKLQGIVYMCVYR